MKVAGVDDIFTYESKGMISGQGEAQDRTYEMHVGESGRAWFVPLHQTNKADNILVTAYADWDKCGEGFARAKLTIHLDDGETFILKGGWHTNAQALLMDTGVDVTHTHLTYGAFGLKRAPGYMAITDLLYRDKEPTLGLHNRIRIKAQKHANACNVVVQYVSGSQGGASAGPLYPGGEIDEW